MLRTEDGKEFAKGARLFNYYDCKWGVVGEVSTTSPGWFDFAHDDGTATTLDGSRVSSYQPEHLKDRNGK